LLWWRWLWRWLWPVVVLSAEVLQAAVLQAAQLLPTDELLPPFELQHLLCTASDLLRPAADLLRSGADLLCTVPVVRRSVVRHDRSAAAEQCSGSGTQCLMCELIPVPDRTGLSGQSAGESPVSYFFAGQFSRRHSPSRTR
jgi:hypothetical protein